MGTTTNMPCMMPGQEPYTPAELDILHSLVHDAAVGDPGETNELTVADEACRFLSSVFRGEIDLTESRNSTRARVATAVVNAYVRREEGHSPSAKDRHALDAWLAGRRGGDV